MAPVQGHTNPVHTVILTAVRSISILHSHLSIGLVVLSLRSLNHHFYDFLRVPKELFVRHPVFQTENVSEAEFFALLRWAVRLSVDG
jgi:hypothetical protein